MMNQNIKTYLKLGIFLFGILLLLPQCQKDNLGTDGIVEENGQNSMFSKGKLKQYSELVAFVDELKQKQEADALSKNASLGNANNFTIAENEDVSVYTGHTTTTYTIPIIKTNQAANTFSNLVIKFSDTQATKAMLMNYEPSQTYLDAVVTNDQTPYSGYASYEAITYDGSFDHLAKGCRTISFPRCNYGGQEHPAGQDCTPSYMWTVRITFCSDDVDPPPALINDSTGGTGGNNGSGIDDALPNDDDIATTPIIEKDIMEQSIIDCINGVAQLNTTDATTIDIEIFSQLGLTFDELNTINNYLQENNCSETAQAQAIEDLLDAYDDYQILNELEGKALCIYNKLKSSSSGFKNAIKKFDGDFPVAHLKLIERDLGSSRGVTSPPINGYSPDYVITVSLNNNSTIQGVASRPNLLTAKTIIHEIIHAEMFRKLMSLTGQPNFDLVTAEELTNLLANSDFPGIYDYYRRHNDWQHAQMATHYRKTLARILQEFDTGVAVPETQQPQQLYLDLSWEGLRYPSIQTWTGLPQAEKDRINTVIANYIINNTNETCTP